MNLKEWTAATGVSSATAWRRHEAGTLPVPSYSLGRLLMVGAPVTGATSAEQVVVYARVPSANQCADLDRQVVARVATWTTAQQLPIARVVTEVGWR